jgi:LysR family glycine cleavage system transcriptional activator
LVRLPPRLPIMAIRYGAQSDPAKRSELLFGDRIVTVATPRTLLELGSEPSGWPPHRLLRHTTGDWQVWWAALGTRETPVASGYACNDADVLLDACEHDLGIALTRLSLAAPRLTSGRLVQAHPLQCISTFRYHLIYRNDAAENSAVRRFRDWLVKQANDHALAAADPSAAASAVASSDRSG